MRLLRPLFALAPLLILITAACGTKVTTTGTGGAGGSGGIGGSGGKAGSTGDAGAYPVYCDGPGQCLLTYSGCCPGCSVPELADVWAIDADYEESFRASTCLEANPACPDCVPGYNPNLYAYCHEIGECMAGDLRLGALSACQSALDCAVRFGTSCCEPCGGGVDQLTALNKNSADDLTALVCNPMESCPACVPVYPPEAVADCVQGHCVVTTLMP